MKNGNKAAFDALFRKYYTQLCNFALQYVRNESLAEELVQDVFVVLWEQKKSLNITTSLLAYLYISTKNTALNKIKKEQTRTKYEKNFALEAENTAQSESAEENKDEKIRHYINQGIVTLPEKCRNIFELSRNDGLTYQEIADFLQISKKTVENQMGIAFKKLRAFLLPHFDKLIVLIFIFFH